MVKTLLFLTIDVIIAPITTITAFVVIYWL